MIEFDDATVGWIQWQEEEEPDYRHASIDIYVDPAVHGQGIGTDAVRTLARHLFHVHGHHRIEIDPAADNTAAIRAYTKVGFRPVGLTRRSERGPTAAGTTACSWTSWPTRSTDPDSESEKTARLVSIRRIPFVGVVTHRERHREEKSCATHC